MIFLKDYNKTAITWKEERISYKALLSEAYRYATLYAHKEGQRVAIFSENRPEWAFGLYSTWVNDRTLVPIDFMSTPDEVAYILEDCQPGVVFCSADTKHVLEQAVNSVNYSPEILVFDDIPPEQEETQPEQILEVNAPDVQKTAVIIYTSGTTGSPKGVMLSFDNILGNVESVTQHVDIYTPTRNVMVMLPLHHVFPLIGSLVAPLFVGSTAAFTASLSTTDIMETLQKHQIAIIIGVPRFYNLLRKGIMEKINKSPVTRLIYKTARAVNSKGFSRFIFKSLHRRFGGHVLYLVSGGAKADEDVTRDFQTFGFDLLEGFGMTEAAPMICFTRPGRVKPGSAGEKMPSLEVKSKDGEIVAKGRNIMQGYFNRKEETEQVLKDGWLHTGDLGYFDDEGFVHITGRRKEILVLSNGKNINPEEIENKLAVNSELISEVGVYMKDDMLQAAIFPDFKRIAEKQVTNLGETIRWEVIDRFNQTVSPYKRIHKFILLKEELPKTRLGKIQRFKLESLLGEGDAKKKKVEEPQFEEYQVIKEYLETQRDGEIYPDSHFEIDLGLDSLDKVSLMTFLHSTFGVDTKEDLFVKYPTLEKLSNYIKEKKVKISVEAVKWAEIFKEKISVQLPKSWVTQRMVKNVFKYLSLVYFRLKGEGIENLPDGPFIIASNHQSFMDGMFVIRFMRNRVLKNTYFYAKEKHVRKKWVKFIADRHNVIVMDINRDLKLSLQKLAEVLKTGRNLVIFPEGTRTSDGNLKNFKKTFAILSRELNIPVVPVAIDGAYEALPRGRVIPKPLRKIKVKFLSPVYPGEHTYDSLNSEVYNRIKSDLTL